MILTLGMSTFILFWIASIFIKFSYDLNKENTIYAKKLGRER